jgi:Fungal N-terminal domain of STAND proteins
MAEILGLISSITALAELATTISLQSVAFVKDVKSAPKTILSLSKEAKSLRSVLDQLEDNLKDVTNSGVVIQPRSVLELASVVGECGKTLQVVQGKLGKFKDPDMLDRVKFVFAERSIAKLQLTLEGHKMTLAIAWLGLVQ